VVQAGGGLGGAIGPVLGGWLFDISGSYWLAFMAACIAVAGSAVAAWFAAARRASERRAPNRDILDLPRARSHRG
jgi:MFS family permease